MTAQNPERGKSNALEPSVGDQLRLGQAVSMLERADTEQLRRLAIEMAQLVFVVHPSTVRYLVKEAAENLRGREEEPYLEMARALLSSEGEAG